jgi:chromosome segregation ATPase
LTVTAPKAKGVDGDPLLIPPAFKGLGITAMYDRVVAAERELSEARAGKQEMELGLARVQKDLASRVPAFTALQRDYGKVVESHGQLSKRLEELVSENSRMDRRLSADSESLSRAHKDLIDLKVQR